MSNTQQSHDIDILSGLLFYSLIALTVVDVVVFFSVMYCLFAGVALPLWFRWAYVVLAVLCGASTFFLNDHFALPKRMWFTLLYGFGWFAIAPVYWTTFFTN